MSLAPQPVMWDQDEYINYAKSILTNGIFTTTSRTYAYPLFIAIHFVLFGIDNIKSIYLSQIMFDVLTGVVIFFLAKKIFSSEKVAYLALILQLINPFTSAYTGVVLTEVTAAFMLVFLILLFYLISLQTHKTPLLLLIFGLTLGFLFETRPMFYWWCLAAGVITPILICPKKKIFISLVIIILGLGLASSYQISSNLIIYKQFSLTSVDSMFARELYDGAILHDAPLFPDRSEAYPYEMRLMYAEYSTTPRNAWERSQMSDKYFKKAISYIKNNPQDYILTRFRKMWTMWQKPNIFFYQEPGFDSHWMITYAVNLLLLIIAVIGMIRSVLITDKLSRKTVWFMYSIVFYLTFATAFSHAEPRLTIPAYPLLFIFAAVGLKQLKTIFLK
jgi:4-amino-4-deoxy-L-arabinose transferase-like glycosyltransferase